MKIGSLVDSTPHKQITTLVNAAAHRAFEDIRLMLNDERKTDPCWFIVGRQNRIAPLVNEIFTFKLLEAVDGKWSEHEIKEQHSSIIAKANASLTTRVVAEYHRLAASMEHPK